MLLVLGWWGCTEALPPPCAGPAPASDLVADNVVVVLMDDVGVDKIGAYGLHRRPAWTPRLDALADQSLMLRSAYAEPVCSAARASLLTGMRPTRTGIGGTVSPHDVHGELDDLEETLAEALRDRADRDWTSMIVGKWHLSLWNEDAPTGPQRQGFDHFDGLIGNPGTSLLDQRGEALGYARWERVIDGEVTTSSDHLIQAQGDRAVQAIHDLPEPFFLYVAMSAAHEPYEAPPPSMYERADPSDLPGIGDAMIEAMDAQIGRIADALGDRGVLMVLADNGTPIELVRPPAKAHRSKATVYAGGARVPWLIRGPSIAPGVSDALVHVTDLMDTVLELAGVADRPATDGVSFASVLDGGEGARRCLIVDRFGRNGFPLPDDHDTAVVGLTHTLVAERGREEELYRRDPGALDDGERLVDLDRDDREALRELHHHLEAGW
ncbi:MAG: sulfatase-like hydrolase/transferase [Alphaproteobacteria bacterium]|nr:sulfatase-like hydrolase/transferase [Alphaproteobacteria bacterium]MCB9695627.1 sulfatase-like hydrolase/transferase [Alphaproteobacteria bacterium]